MGGPFRRTDVPKTKTTPADRGRPSLHLQTGATALRVALSSLIALAWTAGASAQWAPVTDPKLPRDAEGKVRMDAPTPRTAAGKPDLSGLWMRTRSGPPPENAGGGGGGGQLEPEQAAGAARSERPADRGVFRGRAKHRRRSALHALGQGAQGSTLRRARAKTTRMPNACRWGFCSFISSPNHA